jgi:hypothetical protein
MWLESWIATLSQTEQDEFALAQSEQARLRQISIDEGRLTIDDDGSYRWKDQDSFNIKKEQNLVWQSYWLRWQEAVGVKFQIDLVEE